MVRKPKPVAPEVRIRLEKAGSAVKDAKAAYDLAVEQRDKIVVEAVDVHGAGQHAIAEALGVAKGRISAILAGSQPDDGGDA